MSAAAIEPIDLIDYVVNQGNGVKGLSKLGLKSIPKQYIQPPEERLDKNQVIHEESIPIIDVSNWDDPRVVESISEAAGKWGFFQIINHGIPIEVLENVMEAAHKFFELPSEEKKKYLKENSPTQTVQLKTSFSLAEKVLEWKDFLMHFYFPNDESVQLWPSVSKDQVLEYVNCAKPVIRNLLEVLLKGLNVKELDKTKESVLMGNLIVDLMHYPKCPNPDLAAGVGRHSDISSITILLQDDVGGLYVRGTGPDQWIHVTPVKGALVVNIGDILQIVSNDRYKSIEHRVIVDERRDRVSVPRGSESNNGKLEKMNCSLNMNLSLLNNGAITTKNWCSCVSFSSFPSSSSSHQKFHQNPLPKLALINLRSFGRMSNGRCTVNVRQNTATTNSSFPSPSSWDDKPFEVLPNGRVMYLDEQDVVTFLDPPKELIPLDPSTYNPASYLWKKIEDIPEERRHRLLRLLDSRLLSRAWEIAGTRYDDPKLIAKTASGLLSDGKDEVLIHGKDEMPLEFWNCRTNGGPAPIAWMNYFKKALFYSKERNQLYGRFIGGSFLEGISNSFAPLYFTVARDLNEVISTEQPCDLAYEFGEGLLDISVYPDGFPKPAKHPWPFNDEVVVYIRQVGPGVLVGQAWQEGVAMEQLPKKLCGDILMVKDYFSSITADASEATGGP